MAHYFKTGDNEMAFITRTFTTPNRNVSQEKKKYVFCLWWICCLFFFCSFLFDSVLSSNHCDLICCKSWITVFSWRICRVRIAIANIINETKWKKKIIYFVCQHRNQNCYERVVKTCCAKEQYSSDSIAFVCHTIRR